MGVGDRIRRARLARGISATQLAKMIGKDRSTVYRYENGEVGGARVGILEPIAEALGTTPAALMGWTHEWDDPTEPPTKPSRRRIPYRKLCFPPDPMAPAFLQDTPEEYSPMGDFVVRATGEAMTTRNVQEGDLVFVSEQSNISDGEIAAVIINRTLALMRVHHMASNSTTLISENPEIPPIMLENTPNARIVGKVVAFQRAL